MGKIRNLLFFLVIAVLAKGLVWTALVPVFQTPDEQAHFAQLEYMAQNHALSVDSEKNLSLEIAQTESLLGTRRDKFGNNNYTYRPGFRIVYTSTKTGQYEKSINSLPLSSRTEYVDQEAAGYPPLYYLLDMPFYYSVYSHGLIDRLFAGRILSLILLIPLTLIAWQIGREVWGEGIMPLALAVMVSFQPMISFVSAGIHPDNLLNVLYSAGILICLLILKDGLKLKYLLLLGIVSVLGNETKQLMVLFFPLAAAVVLWQWKALGKLGKLGAVVSLILPIFAFLGRWPIPYMPFGFAGNISLADYLRFRLGKLAFEMWPWYWGVFKWLGVTLPPLTLKIITRVGILGGLGIIGKLILAVKNRDFSFEVKALILFLLSSLFYLLYLVLWDWRLMQSIGFSQGLQGRYLFPNIIPEMALLLAGLTVIKRWQKPVAALLIVGMLILNAIALYTVAGSYYDLSTWQTFLVQAAQYKPGIIKIIL